jgi:CubicO group peptidase (beta-lactamase class C family)
MKKIVVTLLVSLLSTSFYAQLKPAKDAVQRVDQLTEQALEQFNVPGIALAIVKDNKVLLSKGYGVRSASGNTQPITDSTLFAIASNSKAFTAAALAILVDRGQITWDDKVRKHLPYFTLYDPYVSEEFTIRDLLCHRSGLNTFSGDLIWYGTSHSREEIVKRARFLSPSFGFREQYGYSNIMYLAAGLIVERLTGMTWDQFIDENFFGPLGMTTSNTSVLDYRSIKGEITSAKSTNIASPHNEVDGKNVAIDYVNWDNIGPAGSINSSVAELTNWIKLQLGKGTLNGRTYWKEQRSWEMWENNTPKPVSRWQREHMPSRHFNGYGLGWELMEYRGHKIVSHGGGYDGMISKTVLVPEINLGFVILTNNINSLPSALTFEILDAFLMKTDKKGNRIGEKKDWIGLFQGFRNDDLKSAQEALVADSTARRRNTRMSLPLAEYCGVYSSEMYGDVLVTMDDNPRSPYGGLKIDFAPTALFKGQLTHWHYDTFELTWSTQMMLPSGKATFVLNEKGKPCELKIVVDNPDFDFTELVLLREQPN